MHTLKGALFSLRGVLESDGKIDRRLFVETVKLLRFLISKGVQPVLVSNHLWTYNETDKPSRNFQDVISEHVGETVPFYRGGVDMPQKQYAEATAYILRQNGWVSSEVVYVGTTHDDMKAAKNGGLLFLTANWHGATSQHGFEFASPEDIARFIDCCCLGLGDWFWTINEGPLKVFTIAPFAQYSRNYTAAAEYSTDARATAKDRKGDIEFWGRLLAARIFFSGLASDIDYVVPYPGHSPLSEKAVLGDALRLMSGSLRASYLADLIVRHTLAIKSSGARTKGIEIGHLNQLRSILIRPDPIKTGPQKLRYKASPLKPGKTVLVVDDICTQGFSMESARWLIESTGAQVINLAWLKTPGANDYQQLIGVRPEITNPYIANLPSEVSVKIHSNSGNVLNALAADQLAAAFTRYHAWSWPS